MDHMTKMLEIRMQKANLKKAKNKAIGKSLTEAKKAGKIGTPTQTVQFFVQRKSRACPEQSQQSRGGSLSIEEKQNNKKSSEVWVQLKRGRLCSPIGWL